MAKTTKNKYRNKKKKKSPLPMILIGLGLIVLAVAVVVLMPKGEQDVVQETPSQAHVAVPGQMDYPAPELQLTDLEDEPVSLVDYRGQWVLVNNWATWCPPCRAEMPDLQAYYEAHKNDGFVLIGISSGDSQPEIEAFANQYQLTFPLWQDPKGESMRAFRMEYLPSSFVIDPSGNVRMVWTGAVSLEALETYITPHLEN